MGSATTTQGQEPLTVDEPLLGPERTQPRSVADVSRRRFILAMSVGSAIVLVPFVWAMGNLWSGSWNPLRSVPYDNFYDLQARAMFHGHLWIPNGHAALGIEGFVHDGRYYTYFGLFPSIIRMPVLLLTSSLDGKLTAPSILLAWMFTAVFTSLILWRLRILMRGVTMLGWLEATAFGATTATIMGGSVILYLAATPWVYNEDFAWSIALTVGSLFALLGMLERPSKGRALASGVLILCTNLDRTPTGYACVIAALLVAGWFALGKGGVSNRRWVLPMLVVGVVPILVGCAINLAKFGTPVGLPLGAQIWTTVNAHRRQFLASNGGQDFSFAFLPSTLWAYFQPFGVRMSGLFPFVTPPAGSATWLGGAVLDQSYPTASFTATSPLLLFLSAWGVVAAFRPRGIGQVRLTRIVLLGAAAGAGGVLLWGYISQRYLADLMPFFIIASGVGFIDAFRRLSVRSRRAKGVALSTVTMLGAYCVLANLAIAAFPVAQWTTSQSVHFVSAEKSLSVDSLAARVRVGTTLPYWAPAGQLFATKGCSGLYISTGNDMKNIPGQENQHLTWLPVEQSKALTRIIGFTFDRSESGLLSGITLMTYGASKLMIVPSGPGHARLWIENSGTSIPWPPPLGSSFPVPNSLVHKEFRITVTVDPNLNSINITWNGTEMLRHYIRGFGPAVVQTGSWPQGSRPILSVANIPATSDMSLCQSLVQRH